MLGGLLPDQYYHAWVTLVRITELVYNTGRDGWSDEDINLLSKLVFRHNILTEESEGTKSCVVTLHNLLHLHEDIIRFSAPDNYWCYTFERVIKCYTNRASNCKNVEHTFARAECRREYMKFCFPDQDSQELCMDICLNPEEMVKFSLCRLYNHSISLSKSMRMTIVCM